MGLLEEGQQVGRVYEVESFLGEGAFAEVYRVKHRILGRQAMKVFKRSGMVLEEVEQLLGEAILLSRLHHPNIIRVFDASTLEMPNGIFGYFTMEHIAGGSLDRFWKSHGARIVPLETAVDLIRQACRGMACAHHEKPPIVHRDIKPQNILVGYDGEGLRVRVSDFGLAKNVNPLTLLATAAGTIPFKAPEVFSDFKEDSCAGDVWSLGSTLYLLLTDRLPVEMDPHLGWRNRAAFDREIDSPSMYNIDIDPYLDRVIMKCLSKPVAQRYQNATDLLAALEKWRPAKNIDADGGSMMLSSVSKDAIGPRSASDQETAEEMARRALRLASDEGRLADAADIMEEAFNLSDAVRIKYSNKVQLWRRGISM